MEVITIDSEAFQSLKEQLNRIESYIERSTTLSKEIDDALELSSKDVMEALAISEYTLYRWSKKVIIRYSYAESCDVRYLYNSLFVGIKCYQIKVPAMPKEEALRRLSEFKDNIILNSYMSKDRRNDKQGRNTGPY